jgi:hypothetical protein
VTGSPASHHSGRPFLSRRALSSLSSAAARSVQILGRDVQAAAR